MNHLIGLFPELGGTGGVQESGRLIALAADQIARERGWSLKLLSLNDAPGDHSLSTGTSTIKFRGFDRRKTKFVLSALDCARHFRAGDRTVVLAAHPNLGPIAHWVRLISPSAKTIVAAHGIEVWTPLPSRRRRALAATDLILAPSRFTAEKIAVVQRISAGKIRRLPWALNAPFIALADSPDTLALPRGFRQGQVILTVGRWASNERYKGADELILAVSGLAQEFADVHLVVAGIGDDLPRLRRLASESSAHDRVHFLEGLSREQLAACYAAADIFALLSTGEGFGFVFLEAMAFAKPVVGVAAGGVTDVIEDGRDGFLIPPHNAPALRQALERLLGDRSLREEFGHNGARKVRERYTFDAFRENLERLIDSLMEGRVPYPEAATQS